MKREDEKKTEKKGKKLEGQESPTKELLLRTQEESPSATKSTEKAKVLQRVPWLSQMLKAPSEKVPLSKQQFSSFFLENLR